MYQIERISTGERIRLQWRESGKSLFGTRAGGVRVELTTESSAAGMIRYIERVVPAMEDDLRMNCRRPETTPADAGAGKGAWTGYVIRAADRRRPEATTGWLRFDRDGAWVTEPRVVTGRFEKTRTATRFSTSLLAGMMAELANPRDETERKRTCCTYGPDLHRLLDATTAGNAGTAKAGERWSVPGLLKRGWAVTNPGAALNLLGELLPEVPEALEEELNSLEVQGIEAVAFDACDRTNWVVVTDAQAKTGGDLRETA